MVVAAFGASLIGPLSVDEHFLDARLTNST
jgi:hypothetical protein